MADFRTVDSIEYYSSKAQRLCISDFFSVEPNGFDRYIAFDIETTGFDPDHDRIIEIGAVLFENGTPTSEFQSLVRTDKAVPEKVSVLTGITDEMLSTAPAPEEVIPRFAEFLGDALTGDTLICGHVTAFDLSFLCRALNEQGISADFRFVDTREAALSIPELTSHSLAAVVEYFCLRNENAHRAKDDAMASGKVLWKYLEKVRKQGKKSVINHR